DAIKPPEELSPTEWAETAIYLTNSDRPGPFSIANTPYLQEPIDAIAEPGVRKITLMSSAQVGKTTCQIVWLGYAVDQDPCPCLLVFHALDFAKTFAVSRLQPVFRESEAIARHLPKKFNQLDVQFHNGARLDITGANSPGNIASRPIQRLFL